MCRSLWKLHTINSIPRELLIFKLLAIDLLKKKTQVSPHSKKTRRSKVLEIQSRLKYQWHMFFFAKKFLDSKKKRFSKWTPSRYLKEQTSCLKFILKCHQKRTKSKPITSLCKVFKWENQYFFTKPFDICVLLCCCSIFCPFTGPPDILLQPSGLIDYKGKFQNSIFTILVFKNSSR